MGLDVHQMTPCTRPCHLLFLLHCCVLHSLPLSTPPTTAPWTPFPHFFPLLLCFICAFPFLPLLA